MADVRSAIVAIEKLGFKVDYVQPGYFAAYDKEDKALLIDDGELKKLAELKTATDLAKELARLSQVRLGTRDDGGGRKPS